MSHQPHDALFRATFSRKEHAIAELRAILPPAVVENIDWDSLHVEEGHYVDEELTKTQSDLLYTVNLLGHPISLYLLFEHKSTGEPLMGYHLLRYTVRIVEKWLGDHPNSRTIPVVLPLVLAHVDGGWKASTLMLELYDLPEELRPVLSPYLPSFRYIVDDLSGLTDEQIRARALRSLGLVALCLMRWARSGNELIGHIALYLDALREMAKAPDGLEMMRMVFRYIMVATGPKAIHDLQALVLDHLEPETRKQAMNMIEFFGKKGRDEGLKKGRDEGLKDGTLEGKRSALLMIFRARGLELPAEIAERVNACCDIEQLDRWIARAVTSASTAEAVLDS